MPTYPGAIVSLSNPASGDAMNAGAGHADQHIKANDEIEAIETELGTTPSGSFSTVADRLADIESSIGGGGGGPGGALYLAENYT